MKRDRAKSVRAIAVAVATAEDARVAAAAVEAAAVTAEAATKRKRRAPNDGPSRFVIRRLAVQRRLQKTDATQPQPVCNFRNFSRKHFSKNTCFASTGKQITKQRTESEIHEFK